MADIPALDFSIHRSVLIMAHGPKGMVCRALGASEARRQTGCPFSPHQAPFVSQLPSGVAAGASPSPPRLSLL